MDWNTYINFPVIYKKWLVNRIQKEIQDAAAANAEGGSNIPSKGAHHNTPDIRSMAGQRPHAPAKLRRF